MKKKLLAVLSLVMVLAMESVTVFATEINSPGTSTVSTSTVTEINLQEGYVKSTDADGNETTWLVDEDATVMAFETTVSGDTDATTTSISATTVTSSNGGTVTKNKISTESMKLLTDKFNEIKANAKSDGQDVTRCVAIDLSYTGSTNADGSVSISINIPGINAENAKNTVVMHFNTSKGVWEQVNFVYNPNTRLCDAVMKSFSPFLILELTGSVVGLTTDANYSTQSTSLSTISGNTSPKTADAYPYAATVAVVAIACVFACSKKIARK
jgi:hypothetical protein